MPDWPSILWYCTDQQRYDTIGALGNPHVRTPVLDRLPIAARQLAEPLGPAGAPDGSSRA